MTIGLIVVAAGTGTRFGSAVHKALAPLAGRPLVEHALRRLLAVGHLDPVVLVGHPGDRVALRRLVEDLPREVRLVDGGARRQDSVEAGLAEVLRAVAAATADTAPATTANTAAGRDASVRGDDDRASAPGGAGAAPDDDLVVLVHDAARPFPPVERLDELVAAARAHGGAVLAVPVADTLKRARDDAPGLVGATVPREGLWAVQTPQAYPAAPLAALLAAARREGRTVTDEAQLVEAAGRRVAFVEGSPLNFKVTTPADLRLAGAVLAHGKKGTPPTC